MLSTDFNTYGDVLIMYDVLFKHKMLFAHNFKNFFVFFIISFNLIFCVVFSFMCLYAAYTSNCAAQQYATRALCSAALELQILFFIKVTNYANMQ